MMSFSRTTTIIFLLFSSALLNDLSAATSVTYNYAGLKCDAGTDPVVATMNLYSSNDGTLTDLLSVGLAATISAGGTKTVSTKSWQSFELDSDVNYMAVVTMTSMRYDGTSDTLTKISSDHDTFQFTLDEIGDDGEIRFNACEDSSSPKTAACYVGIAQDSDSTVVTRMGAPSRDESNGGACCVPGARGGCTTSSPTLIPSMAPTQSPTTPSNIRRRTRN